MTTTASGFFYPATSYTSGIFQALKDAADSQETVIGGSRQIKTYQWTNATARAAQTGMAEGDTGYQADTDTYYSYTGSAWAPTIYGSNRIIPTAATNGSVSVAGVVTSTAQTLVRVRTAFPAAFTVFRVVYDVTTSAAAGVNLQFAVDATDAATAYDYEYVRGFSTTVDAAQSLNQTTGALSPIGLLAGRHFGSVLITGVNAAAITLYEGSSIATLNPMTTSSGKLSVAGQHRTTTAYNSLTLIPGSGNITINRLTVEGVS